MIEKVNPKHPDKIADRIAGAIVDYAYTRAKSPKIATEILIGHGVCHIIIETDVEITEETVYDIVKRIAGDVLLDLVVVPQDIELSKNQSANFKCGDNGIFKGVPVTEEEYKMSFIARGIYKKYFSDGKYILSDDKLIICQSRAARDELEQLYPGSVVNPLGYWTGGTDVDTGATNRKLGSDMAQSVTGGGIHGKDLSKADVAVNIYAFLKAQRTGQTVELSCAIGDSYVDAKPYEEIVRIAEEYIQNTGGFEKLAEWGLF